MPSIYKKQCILCKKVWLSPDQELSLGIQDDFTFRCKVEFLNNNLDALRVTGCGGTTVTAERKNDVFMFLEKYFNLLSQDV